MDERHGEAHGEAHGKAAAEKKGPAEPEREVGERERGEAGPDYAEIAEELKRLGASLRDVLEATAESERAKELRQRSRRVFNDLSEGASRIKQDAVSGRLERDLRKGLYGAIHNLNEQLREYLRSKDES
ncbi:MAG: hypothetical protein C4521_07820 [Actinobacteria bacterium]|nr:MAG: hypothetical protein C4521_07820 [Actinomycetota bacterium]